MAAPALDRYTPDPRAETVERIAQRIENGELAVAACDAERIHYATLRRWLAQDAALDARYTHARSVAADALAEEAVRIAVYGEGDAQERRLAYDALRWLAGKRRPHEYGDKQTVEHTGTVGHLHLDALRASRVDATARIANGSNALRDTVALPLHGQASHADDTAAGSIEGVEAGGTGDAVDAPPHPE